MLDIVQSFPLLSYCIVSPIYISPICNVEIYYSEEIKIRNSLFFLSSQVLLVARNEKGCDRVCVQMFDMSASES